MRIRLHKITNKIHMVFGMGYWLRYPCRLTGLSLVIKQKEVAVGNCMTYKRLADLLSAED